MLLAVFHILMGERFFDCPNAFLDSKFGYLAAKKAVESGTGVRAPLPAQFFCRQVSN